MRKFKILLLNCAKKSDPNEAEFLSHFFTMMKVEDPENIDFQSVNVRTKKELKEQLENTWPNIIHIAAHGDSECHPKGNRGKETSIEVGRGSINSREIEKLGENPLKLVFVSAYLNSYEDMANAFLNRGAEKYIAPKTKVDWVHAALFSTMFYNRYVYKKPLLMLHLPLLENIQNLERISQNIGIHDVYFEVI